MYLSANGGRKISIRGYTQFRYNYTPNNDLLTSPGIARS
jgi:hypothetical protein